MSHMLKRRFAECQTPSFGFAEGKVIAVRDNQVWVFTSVAATEQHRRVRHGAVIGGLAGLIGLGGAEFRLPLLISLFRFPRARGGYLEQGDQLGRRYHGASEHVWRHSPRQYVSRA
jgi:hypothetical protein